LRITGLLTSAHPYHQEAEVTHFLAHDGKQLLGRVSAAVNHRYNDYYNANIGFFGFFETIEDFAVAKDLLDHDDYYNANIGFFGFFETIEDFAVAKDLLDHARDWLKEKGMNLMRGPGGYSTATHESHQGILIDGFDSPPTVELTHNPPYYGEFLTRYGLTKAKDYHAYWIDISNKPNESGHGGGSKHGRSTSRTRERRSIGSSRSTTRPGRGTGDSSLSPTPRQRRWRTA
jgi:GNAT superfamily N-acetyltransferase